MREILFRGKKDNGEWWYGLPLRTLNKDGEDVLNIQCWERDEEGVTGIYDPVDPETVGQYIGLTDKNGSKIFEGDIVKATIAYNNCSRDKVDYRTNIYEVKYHEKYCYFYLARKNNNLLFDGNWSYGLKTIEVIDNIHDNPGTIKE